MNPTRPRSWKKPNIFGRFRRFAARTNLAKNLVLLCIAGGIAGTIGLLGLFAYAGRNLPDPNTLNSRSVSQTTKIFDRTGEHLLYEVHGEQNRTLVKLQEGFCDSQDEALQTDPNGIPLKMLQATITAEDRAFCSHHGFSVKGLARAAIFLGRRGGGSTLTQQLVKNALLSNERNLFRKVKELIISIELERRYSKDQILQIYFNEIGYGSTYYGAQAASTNYFKKPVNELSLAQMATLAALPQRPSTFLNNPDLLKARRDWILDGMVELGYATQEEVDVAKAEDTQVAVGETNIDAPHFVFYIKQQLEDTYGQYTAEQGGLKVITSLDYDLQKIAEEEVVAGVEKNGEKYKFGNASLVAIDPKTGQVLAMVGSKDYYDKDIDGQVNISLRPRQPGSSFKPIVFAAGFEKGYTPNTILWDVHTTFPTDSGPYTPYNYHATAEHGPIRARDALQGSLNIPAVEMIYLVGIGHAIDFAQRFGYTTFEERDRFGLAFVLGAGEVKLLEHTNTYAAFANEGKQFAPVSILKIEDSNGKIMQEWKEEEGKQVVEQNIAREVSNVLSDNNARAYIFGTGSALQLGGRPVAAKSGTTNDNYDAWTMGYTPSLAAGVWVGNSKYVAMTAGADGSIVAAPIWNAFMRRALEGKPVESFTAPQIPVTGKAILDGSLPSTTIVVDKASGKLATEYTPDAYREERTYAEYHSVLHYLYKDDPLGAAPEDPAAADAYYTVWEQAIADWITRRETETGIKITQSAAPTEYDDVHIPANFPSTRISQPDDGVELNDRQVAVEVDAEAVRGVERVEFYLDGFFLGSDSSRPWKLSTEIPNTVSRGYHTIKAVAYDDVGNTGADTIGVRVMSEPVAASLSIMDPKNGQTIERTSSTFTVVVSVDHPTDYASVTLYAQQIGQGSRTVVETKQDPSSPFLTYTWTLPEDGDWALSASATPSDGGDAVQTTSAVVHITSPNTSTTVVETPVTDTTTEDTVTEPVTTPLPTLDPFSTPTTTP